MRHEGASLKQQVELLREIARRQADELDNGRRSAGVAHGPSGMGTTLASHAWPASEFAQGSSAAGVGVASALGGVTANSGEMAMAEAELAAERREVSRLCLEVEELRAARNCGDAPQAINGLAAPSSPPRTRAQFAGGEMANARFAQRAAEINDGRYWESEHARLETALTEARANAHRANHDLHVDAAGSARRHVDNHAAPLRHAWGLASASSMSPTTAPNTAAPTMQTTGRWTGSSTFTAAQLQDDILAERQAASVARDRAAMFRQEQRSTRSRQSASEELAHLQQRLQAEAELRQSQRVQLDAANEAVTKLRAQLAETRRNNSEMRAALERHQDLLARLQC